MDFNSRLRDIRLVRNVQTKAHTVLSDVKKIACGRITPIGKTAASSATLGLLGVGMGIVAFQWSSESAVQTWLEEHAPTPALWQSLLRSQGYHAVENENDLHRAVRTLPVSL